MARASSLMIILLIAALRSRPVVQIMSDFVAVAAFRELFHNARNVW